MTIRVVVADDQDLVRTGLAMILNAQPDIEVVGQAANGADAVDLARRLRPDVCLLDIGMPKMDGIEATSALAGPEVEDPIPIVIITTFEIIITASTIESIITIVAFKSVISFAATERVSSLTTD